MIYIKFEFSKEIYSKPALLKAAYRFTDEYYVHIDVDDNNYTVDLIAKNSTSTVNYEDFKNEILSQVVRENIFNETKEIRTLLMARALSSSMIDTSSDESEISESEEENILKDWFEQ